MKTSFHVRYRRLAWVLLVTFLVLFLFWEGATRLNWNLNHKIGDEIDRLNGVPVFYNGGVAHGSGRSLAPDGYNLGIKYQCVEFVKRYYYQYLNHKMPDSYGHAKQFFDPALSDGVINTHRALVQFPNGGTSKPRVDDILVFGPSIFNRYGHVAIVSSVSDSDIEIVQQNPGPFGPSRERIPLIVQSGHWSCRNNRVLGWLRKVTGARVETNHSPVQSVNPRATIGKQ